MAVPIPVLRVDWEGDGTFTDAFDTVHPLDNPALTFQRGRSGDFTTDATGQLTFALDNSDDAYSPDRNWCDNPSFESDTSGWNSAAASGFTAAASSITRVADVATGTGAAAGEVVLPATLGAGVTYPIAYRFRAGYLYSVGVWLKSMSGSVSIAAGLGSVAVDPYWDLALGMPETVGAGLGGVPVDQTLGAGTITGSWVQYTFTWRPLFDTTAACLFLRVTTAAAATFRVDAVQVNPGALNAYLEAPTKGQLVPGRPVHLYASYLGVSWPLFFGYVERITPDPQARKVAFTVFDVMRRFSETDVVVPANALIQRTARDFRIAVLEDYERGNLNFLPNPNFATDLSSWYFANGSAVRTTTNYAPVSGAVACASYTPNGAGPSYYAWAYTRFLPQAWSGVVYRFSVYLRANSPGSWTIALGTDPNTTRTINVLSVTTAWKRFSVTFQPASMITASAVLPLIGMIWSSGGMGAVMIGAASLTRGIGQLAYSDTGTGRSPNYCANGSFDGGALNGWMDGWSNLCTNGSFEVDTTGWASVTRSTAAQKFGAASGIVGSGGTGTFNLSGTFKAGVTYDLSAWGKCVAGTGPAGSLSVKSIGTPADIATVPWTLTTGWASQSVAWTPTADRSDAQIAIHDGAASGGYYDGIMLTRRDSALGAGFTSANYWDGGPGGGGSFVSAHGLASSPKPRWGALAMSLTLPATQTAGKLYDFAHAGPYFVAGCTYVVSVWLRSSTPTAPVKVGISGCGPGVADEASTTATVNNVTWTQVSLTWTPTIDHSCGTYGSVALFVYQTDATARTIYVDGVRVIPGAVADNFEQPYWDVPATCEPEAYSPAAYLSGTALQCLNQLNGLTLTRHWIVADMSAPYWRYRAQDRTTYSLAANAESYVNDAQAITPPEIDRQAIANIVGFYGTAQDYLTDATSAAAYGYRTGAAIAGGTYITNQSDAQAIAQAPLDRYAQPIRRPIFSVENRWPSQLQRDVNDMVTVTIDPWLIRTLFGSIARATTTVAIAGQHWKTEYQIEESANPDGGYGSLAASLPE